MAQATLEDIFGTPSPTSTPSAGTWSPSELEYRPSIEDIFAAEPPAPGFTEELGQLGGGIAGGIRGAQLGFEATPPVTPWAKPLGGIAGGALGSFIGGGTGEAGQQVVQTLTDSPYAPENLTESLDRVFKAGSEEAFYDFLGSTIFKTVGLGWRAVRPKPTPGIEDVQKTLDQFGIQLSAAQQTDNKLINTVEGLVESAWGGGRVRNLRTLNDEGIKRYTDSFVNDLANGAANNLTDEGLGRLFINTLEGGRSAHSKTAEVMFGSLDDIWKTRTRKVPVNTQVNTGLQDASGNPIFRTETTLVEKAINPVNTKNIKKITDDILKLQKEIGGATLGEYGNALVKNVSSMQDNISFKAAQELRSGILSNIRQLEGKEGAAKVRRLSGQLAGAIDNAIETAAKKSDNPELLDSWREANKFWKTGKSLMDTDFLGKLVQKNPEAIGETIFSSGNVTQIKEARRALRAANKYSGGQLDFPSTWKKMQTGYLRSLIAKTADSETGELSVKKLSNFFVKNTPQNRTLNNAFTGEQRDALKSFIKNVEIAQKRPEGVGTFMVTVGQAGLVLAATTGVGMGAVDPAEAAAFTIAPAVLARMLTNPRATRLIVQGMNTKVGGQQAGAITAKIMEAAGYFGED